jgi:hypothetical protein
MVPLLRAVTVKQRAGRGSSCDSHSELMRKACAIIIAAHCRGSALDTWPGSLIRLCLFGSLAADQAMQLPRGLVLAAKLTPSSAPFAEQAGTLFAVGALFLVGGDSDVRAGPLAPLFPGGMVFVINGGDAR